MAFSLESFVRDPTREALDSCRKADLLEISRHFDIEVSAGSRKDEIKKAVEARLVEKKLLAAASEINTESKPEVELSDSEVDEEGSQKLKLKFKLKLEQLKMDQEKMRLEFQEREREREEREREREREAVKAIRLKELELEEARIKANQMTTSKDFDLARNSRLVPPFNEKEVTEYFTLFERVADTLKWPEEFRPLLLQSVLVGKAQSVYASLSVTQSSDYKTVKEAILRSYELVPEAYRQQFRRLKKAESQTYTEFAREQQTLFDRWCKSQDVKELDDLKNLILLEQFKNCVDDRVATYLNEHKGLTLEKAAILADEFVLTHKGTFFSKSPITNIRPNPSKIPIVSKPVSTPSVKKPNASQIECHYCHTKGHFVRDCPVLAKKAEKTKAVILLGGPLLGKPLDFESVNKVLNPQPVSEEVPDEFAPFVSEGFVSLPGDEASKKPVRILRDTAASQSILLRGVLPLTGEMESGNSVLLRGVEMNWIKEPLFNVFLESGIATGPIEVALRDGLPVGGITFLLGNDVAGDKVTSDLNPILMKVPKTEEDMLSKLHPSVFSSCVVTRAMAKKRADDTSFVDRNDSLVDLSKTFLCNTDSDLTFEAHSPVVESEHFAADGDGGDDTSVSLSEAFMCDNHSKDTPNLTLPLDESNVSNLVEETNETSTSGIKMSREQLVIEQERDISLSPLYAEIGKDIKWAGAPVKYYKKDGVLMRKWQPCILLEGAKSEVSQIVVPAPLRSEILKLAHAGNMAGHLGISKTYDRILQNFFWPGLKTDVKNFCKTCQVCQFTSKPNQKVPVAPLHPIPAFDEPFSKVLVDCVGPLPRTRSGNQFILTIMCASTRFPEAVPLRKITARSVVKALVKFFSVFGIPKVVQSDQGSNFMSKVFQQVMQQLGTNHCPSSAYHPESQGALERFHATLKSMLRAYCREFKNDWDEGVPLVLFAAREVVQESLGFSPNELVFGHRVRGPMSLLKEKLLEENSSSQRNLLEYVSAFHNRLRRACEIAGENLKRTQTKMKVWYDRKARARSFDVGDQVLILLPVIGSPLEARFSGPYTVEEKVGHLDYIISTPERRKKKRLCHINMMKPYYAPNDQDQKSKTHKHQVAGCAVVNSSEARYSTDQTVTEPVVQLGNSEILANLDSYLSHLDPKERADVSSLLCEFESIFSDVPSETNVLEHDIDVGLAQPIKQHAYRVNPAKRVLLRNEVEYMVKHGIAEPSDSSWSSPCILVPKADTTNLRFCSDFRKVNSVTKPDSYPLPRVDDCVDRVGSARFVSKFDLLKGYWQVPLTQRAKEISAFVIPDGLFAYRRMPFGLRNAGATFQRLMHIVLRGLNNAEAYIDDVVVFSDSWSDHLKHVREVFERLKAASLTVNLGKSNIAQATVKYLGKVIGQGKVLPVAAKVEVILKFPVPSTRKELKRFLGMAGYYRAFCRNFAQVVSPLTHLTSPKVLFQWTPECQNAFEKAKALLANAPVLKAPDFSHPFALYTDASDVGVGAVLVQNDDSGIEHPVAFFSRKLSPCQVRYSTIEKETLALILALEHFEIYVSTSDPLLVYTDHNPLLFLQRSAFTNRRLLRWSLALQEIPLKIQHVKGTDNLVADCLSRVVID